METKNKIINSLSKISNLPESEIMLEVSGNAEFGDYTSNVAMKSFDSSKWKNPREYAEDIKTKLMEDKSLDKVIDNDGEAYSIRFGTGFGSITDIEVGPDGLLYVLSFNDGVLYKIYK